MLNANVAFANGANHIGEVRTVSVRELAGVAGFIFGMAVSVMAATGLAQRTFSVSFADSSLIEGRLKSSPPAADSDGEKTSKVVTTAS